MYWTVCQTGISSPQEQEVVIVVIDVATASYLMCGKPMKNGLERGRVGGRVGERGGEGEGEEERGEGEGEEGREGGREREMGR